jgi:hypothetical protein
MVALTALCFQQCWEIESRVYLLSYNPNLFFFLRLGICYVAQSGLKLM